MTTDPAVTAAAYAMCDGSHGWEQPCAVCEAAAPFAVAAARPIIEAEVRARIAAEIERGIDGRTGVAVQAWDEALRRAARIARGQA